MKDYNKLTYGAAAYALATALIAWLNGQGYEISPALSQAVIIPAVTFFVVWGVPNGIGVLEYIKRVVAKQAKKYEKELDSRPNGDAE